MIRLRETVASTRTRLAGFLVAIAILIGALLRFAYPLDIEYKQDESFMFCAAQNVGRTEPWPAVGLPSGGGVRNPPLSIWSFVAAARLFRATDPVKLAMIVAGAAVAATLVLALMAVLVIDEKEKPAWLWGIALACVNPNQVQLQRKIWAQSLFPIFSAVFLWAWFCRRNAFAAFLWGGLGVVLGQIHLSGFFFAVAVALWTGWSERRQPRWKMWTAWVAGSVAGCMPMIPWLRYLLKAGLTETRPETRAVHLLMLQLKFWVLWIADSSGLGMNWSLGMKDYLIFLRNPVVALAHVIAGLTLAVVLFVVVRSWLPANRGEMSDSTGLLNSAAFWGFGTLMTLAGAVIQRHYLIVAFPLVSVWFARYARQLGKSGTALLGLAWLSQLTISVAFLMYIHANRGARGDYGPTLGSQPPIQQSKLSCK
jgi:hypothetical protein